MSGDAAVGEVQYIETLEKSWPEKYQPEGSSEYSSKPGLGTRFSGGDFCDRVRVGKVHETK